MLAERARLALTPRPELFWARMSSVPLAERYVDLGVKAIDEDDVDKAIRYLNRALSLDPQSYLAYYNRGVANDLRDRLQDALADYERIIELEPNDAFAYTSLSIFLQRKGDVPGAEAAAAKARMISWKEELKTNPDAPPPGPPGGMDVIQ